MDRRVRLRVDFVYVKLLDIKKVNDDGSRIALCCELESRDASIVGLANVCSVCYHLFDKPEIAIKGGIVNRCHSLLLLVLLIEPLC